VALTESSATRRDDSAGKEIKTLLDGTDHIQAIAVVGSGGSQSGIAANPFDVEEQETVPTDTSKNNPSFALTYTGSNLTQIDMTISGSTYEKTLTWTGSNVTAVTAWSAA